MLLTVRGLGRSHRGRSATQKSHHNNFSAKRGRLFSRIPQQDHHQPPPPHHRLILTTSHVRLSLLVTFCSPAVLITPPPASPSVYLVLKVSTSRIPLVCVLRASASGRKLRWLGRRPRLCQFITERERDTVRYLPTACSCLQNGKLLSRFCCPPITLSSFSRLPTRARRLNLCSSPSVSTNGPVRQPTACRRGRDPRRVGPEFCFPWLSLLSHSRFV